MPLNYFEGKDRLSYFSVLLVIYVAFAAGYTVADFPQYFFDFLKSPFGQFLVYLPVIYVTYKSDAEIPYLDMVFEAILMVIAIQILKYTLNQFA
jgi:hypothetical protein